MRAGGGWALFQDIDASLTALLTDADAPAELRAATISFQPPDTDFAPQAPTINLFLLQVQENRDLRSAPALIPGAGQSGYTRVDAPLRVDATYMLTAWSIQSAELKINEEHRLLGQAMAWIGSCPTLPPRCAAGSLAGAGVLPIPLTMAPLNPEETLSHFFSALGIVPRPMFTLTATVQMSVLSPDPTPAPVPPVQQINLIEGALGGWALRGQVRDSAGAPVPGAVLTVVQTGDISRTDTAGMFEFTGLNFGDYTLRIRAAGRPPDPPQTVQYRPDSELLNILVPTP
jgi:hypothetical protein